MRVEVGDDVGVRLAVGCGVAVGSKAAVGCRIAVGWVVAAGRVGEGFSGEVGARVWVGAVFCPQDWSSKHSMARISVRFTVVFSLAMV